MGNETFELLAGGGLLTVAASVLLSIYLQWLTIPSDQRASFTLKAACAFFVFIAFLGVMFLLKPLLARSPHDRGPMPMHPVTGQVSVLPVFAMEVPPWDDKMRSIDWTADKLRQLRIGADTDSKFSRLVKGLDCKDSKARSWAADCLVFYAGLSGEKKSGLVPVERADVGSLARLLRTSEKPELRDFAVREAGRLGIRAKALIKPLVDLARAKPERELLVPIFEALRRIGDRTEETQLRLLEEEYRNASEPKTRDAAVLALLELGPARLGQKEIVTLMASDDGSIRTAAEKALRDWLSALGRKGLSDLRTGLKIEDAKVRLVYIEAIGALRESGHDLATDLHESLADVRFTEAAARALENVGGLLDVARESTDAVALTAALNILKSKKSQTPETMDVYEKQLNHRDSSVKELAALALLEHDPSRLSVDRLVELMTGSKGKVRSATEARLRELMSGSAKVRCVASLGRGLRSKDARVQLAFIAAIQSLGDDGRAFALDLAELIESQEQKVAVDACRALGKLGQRANVAVPWLAGAVKSKKDMNDPVRRAAARALWAIDAVNPLLGCQLLLSTQYPPQKGVTAWVAVDGKTVRSWPVGAKRVTVSPVGPGRHHVQVYSIAWGFLRQHSDEQIELEPATIFPIEVPQ